MDEKNGGLWFRKAHLYVKAQLCIDIINFWYELCLVGLHTWVRMALGKSAPTSEKKGKKRKNEMKMKKYLLMGTLVGVVSMAAQASVITDGGFEGAALGGVSDNGGVNQWANFNVTADNCVVTDAVAHLGSQSLLFNQFSTGSQDYSVVYQNTGASVPTVLGDWDYSFWVYTSDASGTFNYGFLSSNTGNVDMWEAGGNGVIDAAGLTANTWTEVTGSFTVTAVGSTLLKSTFSQVNSTASFYIDDVTLTAVPEPATLGLVAAFGGGVLFIRRRLVM